MTWKLTAPPLPAALAQGALLDPLLEIGARDDALHENAGCVDLVAVDLARLDQVLDLDDRHPSGRCHDRVEVARRLAEDEVALLVGLPGVDDRQIGDETALHDVGFAVELAQFLPLRHQRADAGLGEEGGYAGAAGADA